MTNRKLKVFVPDRTEQYERTFCTPFFYPFLDEETGEAELVSKYGEWINDIIFVKQIEESDVVILFYELLYYYSKNKLHELERINKVANAAGKTTICWVKGDHGVTPALNNFHLYRVSGYKSRNKGNQFSVPVFIIDPVEKYYEGTLPPISPKTNKPNIGFCGQGKADLAKALVEIARGVKVRLLKLSGKWRQDVEELKSTTYKRSLILDALEQFNGVQTNFIRHRKYRAGLTSKDEKEASSKVYFQNMADSQYIVCYRGNW